MNKLRIKIIIGIAVALFLTSALSPQIFIGNSPRLNPTLGERILQLPSKMLALIKDFGANNFFVQKKNSSAGDDLNASSQKVDPAIMFKNVSKGVSASENNTYVKIENGTKIKVYTYTTSSGKKYEIYIPQ